MDSTWLFGVVAVVYCVLFFFDRFFKSCMHYPYDAFLKNTGLTVQFLRLRWHTTAFNRTVLRWGNSNSGGCSRYWLGKSFTVGVLVALSLLPVGIILLFITIFSGDGGGAGVVAGSTAQTDSVVPASVQGVKVEILLPGVNLPLDEVGYYVLTLLLSTVVHELGHALAAALEDIPVTGFGVQFYFCLPLAYTEICAEHLNSLKWLRKLRILCAGIWHNFVFACICYLLLSTLGFMAVPLYTCNRGVIITEVTPRSPLRAKSTKGLLEGQIITQINDCSVSDVDSWYACLLHALRNKPCYCVAHDFIRDNDESIEIAHHGANGMLQCCDEKNEKLSCFESTEGLNGDDLTVAPPVDIPQHVCLDVRRTLEQAYGYCTSSVCERGFCLRPLLRNTTTILTFKRSAALTATVGDGGQLRDAVYMGHPADVTRTVRISPFVPRRQFVSPQWADAWVLFLKYNIVFSFGLALINAIPCFGFDGYHITGTIVNSFLVNRVTERPKRDIIALIVIGIGTLLFGSAVLKVLWLNTLRFLF